MKNRECVLYVVMPAYNEEKNIAGTVESWIKVLEGKSEKSRLVIADSGSTDKTHDILVKLQKQFKKLEILSTTNQYHGPKLIALYKYAIENGADYVFQTDSDGQTDPNEFAEFWDEKTKYDAILGCRRKRGDGKIRTFVEKVVCCLLRMFFGVKAPDANAPFRLMKTTLVKKYINKLPLEYDLPNIMLTAYFLRFNEKVLFKDITFKPREAGVNSINLKKIFRIGWESLGAFWHFRKEMQKDDCSEETKHKGISTLIIILCFAIASFAIIVNSPAFPWRGGEIGTDSSVFLTVGRQMQEGMVPYRDTFDHKGPLLYLINYFSVMINETSGFFVFEFLSIFFTMWFMYKIIRLKVKSLAMSGFLTLILFTPFFAFYLIDFGNMTEQYAMPFIAGSLYVFLKYLINGKISKISIFMVGLSFACVLMLRMNMIGVWAVFCLAVLIKNIKNKSFKELRTNIGFFALGVATVLIPIVIWLVCSGAFSDFFDVYIKFNLSYSKNGMISRILAGLHFVDIFIIIASFILSAYYAFGKKDEKTIFRVYLIAMIAVLITVCMSGRTYPHYGLVLIPLVAFPFATLYSKIEQIDNSGTIGLMLIIFLVSFAYGDWLKVLKTSVSVYRERGSKVTTNEVSQICGYINEATDASERIVVYGNWNYIYLKCNRLPASRYSYQFPIGTVKPKIFDEFFDEISNKRPKVFVVQGSIGLDSRAQTFLDENGYTERQLNGATEDKIFILDSHRF